MNRKHYNESERLALLREYYSSGLSKYAFIKKAEFNLQMQQNSD